ncbi:aromatic acid exporter family protein [Nocardiopsis sp. N85]|uniref:aromatic acid exporter family protein n=1 Tax=Nocardiopsis sp. N85 TaxID=3029400 RepID=UPI00237F537E|nr:aromatic acid exporter family protein [Nocardiopsis sp. N85]MDE3724621.1 aromatic acid exporter family protein [Nocardiopsis sp. N85]
MDRDTEDSVSPTAGVRRLLRRVPAFGGRRRETAVLLLKATLATTLAWILAHHVIGAASPAFAPFAALMMVEITVYRSLLRSLRMVGAVVLGIALTTVLVAFVGLGPVDFALAALLALAIGRWRRLGDQGTQVGTAAFFAFAVFSGLNDAGELLGQAVEIFVVVLVGSATGVTVNLLLLPPLRLRGVARAVTSLAGGLRRLCEDIGETLREGHPDRDTAEEWRSRTEELARIARQARETSGVAWESTFYNPRRLFHRDRLHVHDHDRLIDSLERAIHQIASVARSLARGREEAPSPTPAMTARCGDLILAVAGAWRVLEDWRGSEGPTWDPPVERFHEAVERVDRCERELEEACRAPDGPPVDDPGLPYGALLLEASRLNDELDHVDEVLRASVEHSR